MGWTHLEGIDIAFVSGAMPDDSVELRGLAGREKISRLYEFDLVLWRPTGPFTDAELDDLLKAPVAIAMGPDEADLVHGVLQSIEAVDSPSGVAPRYFAKLVPQMWLLTLARTNRVFQNLSVHDIVREVLTGYGLVEGTHFDIHGEGKKREYVVQYEESDWDFVQRWLEREGLFYWFEQDPKNARLVVADENGVAQEIPSPKTLSYRESNNLSTGGAATIFDWHLRQKRTAARVALIDHNYEQGEPFISGKSDVDADRGFGTVFSFGENFTDDDDGNKLAALRAERLFCERRIYSARTDCSRMRVGKTFELSNHRDDGDYLITSIEHQVGHPLYGRGHEPQRYLARIEAIPKTVPFRPARLTPWPRIDGILCAHIEADGDGAYAQIDDQGRYRVKIPFDLSGKTGSKASVLVRLAEPYSGAAYGVHYPLHKGSEVLLAHIAGDPDRPIILSAIPNPRTPSPVTRANATQSVVRTASGIHTEMEDLES